MNGEQQARALGRAPFFALVLALLLAIGLTHPRPAAGQDDAVPTWWHEATGLTPLLTAPPPPNPATICVIDTGVTPTPDLDITARWAYDGGTPDDVHAGDGSPGHGTVVAHFAAGAVNGWGGAGAFPHARISSVRVFPAEGGASWREYIAAISRCLKLDANTKVIVISIGGQEIDPGEADELEHWIIRARDRHDANVVVAAGNGGNEPDFPGRFPAAFTVGGVSASGDACSFSARGQGVDIAAPGCDLTQSDAQGRGWALDGTSFAAPIVAGVLAALRSYAPAMTAPEAEHALTRAQPGVPMLDADAALQAAGVTAPPADPDGKPLVPSPPAASPPTSQAEAGPGARVVADLKPPRVRARSVPGGVVLAVSNRRAGSSLEVVVGTKRLRRRASRVRLRTASSSVRCRFVNEDAKSKWTAVRW